MRWNYEDAKRLLFLVLQTNEVICLEIINKIVALKEVAMKFQLEVSIITIGP